MKKLAYCHKYEQVFQKDKTYIKSEIPCLHYVDEEKLETSEQYETDDFDDLCEYHNINPYNRRSIIIWFDDDAHRITYKKFRLLKIITYYTEMPESWSICQIMRELPYQEFIEFCKDNGVAVTM